MQRHQPYVIGDADRGAKDLKLREWSGTTLAANPPPKQSSSASAIGGVAKFTIVVTERGDPRECTERCNKNRYRSPAGVSRSKWATPPQRHVHRLTRETTPARCVSGCLTERMQWLRMGHAETVATRKPAFGISTAAHGWRWRIQVIGEAPQASALGDHCAAGAGVDDHHRRRLSGDRLDGGRT